MCLDPRSFGPSQLRLAVEHLKTIPNTDDSPFVGLCAETHVRAAKFRLIAKPFLRLDQILGRTPDEVWELFDSDVDEQRRSMVDRWLGKRPVSYDEYLA